MSTNLIMSGFSGYGKIGVSEQSMFLVSLLSYDITPDRKLIKTNGVYPSINTLGDLNSLYRNSGPIIPDALQVSVNIQFQATLSLLNMFVNLICTNRNRKIITKFIDNSKGFDFSCEECYLQSFNLSCGENDLLTINVKLFARNTGQNFVMVSTENEMIKINNNVLPFDKNNKPIAYWEMQFLFNGKTSNDIFNFSFDYVQNLNKRYGLMGLKNAIKAPQCQKVYFERPTINFNLSRIMTGNQEYNLYSDTGLNLQRYVTREQLQSSSFSIVINKSKIIQCNGVCLQDSKPTIASKDRCYFQQQYMVLGSIK